MSATPFLRFANAGVQQLKPYEPGKPVDELERELGISDIIKLASNENPLGASVHVDEMLDAGLDWSRYPDGSGFRLKHALASSLGVATTQITLGNGSNDVLELVARVFLRQGCNAVCSAHAFAVYPIITLAAGAELRQVPALPVTSEQPYGHDLPAFAAHIDENTRVVFIANPNNPTGTWVDPQQIEQLLETVSSDVVVVLDEAYCEYQDPELRPDAIALMQRYPNLMVTRTFSKVYGLAALRVGYALSHPDIADLLNRVRQPFNNNSVALMAAEIAWQDQAHVAASVAINDEGMETLTAALVDMGLTVLPSQANFICVDFGRPAQEIYNGLLREGVIVRPLAGYAMPNHLRITVGLPAENQRCIDALRRVLQ